MAHVDEPYAVCLGRAHQAWKRGEAGMQTADDVEACVECGLEIVLPVLRQHATRGCHSDDNRTGTSSGRLSR